MLRKLSKNSREMNFSSRAILYKGILVNIQLNGKRQQTSHLQMEENKMLISVDQLTTA